MAVHAPSEAAIPDDLVAVGQVATAHGVQGWLKVRPYAAPGLALQSARTWWLTPSPDAPDRARTLRVSNCREAHAHLLVRSEDITDRDAALALRGWTIWVPRSAFPAPDADEYYWVDLVGCDFYSLSAGQSVFLGRVDDVLDNGAHAILQVALGHVAETGVFCAKQDARGRAEHVLIPFVAAHVQHVSLSGRRIDGNWPVDF